MDVASKNFAREHYNGTTLEEFLHLPLTTLCLEEACPTFKAPKATIAKLAAILKPGGHLIISSMLGDIYYKVEDLEQVINTTPYTEKQMKETVSGAGLSMKEQHQYIRHSNELVNDVDDYTINDTRSFGSKEMVIL